MNNSTLFRIGGIALILGILLVVGGYAIPALLGIGMLLMALFYYALDKFLGSSMLSLAAAGSAVVGAKGNLKQTRRGGLATDCTNFTDCLSRTKQSVKSV
jgi:hypothetical protein